jgi:hypothetical protein
MLALASLAKGGLSVGIVRLQTKAHGVCFCPFVYIYIHIYLCVWKPEEISRYSYTLQTGRLGFDFQQVQQIIPFSTAAITNVWSTQISIQTVTAAPSGMESGRYEQLIPHRHIVLVSEVVPMCLYIFICLHGVVLIEEHGYVYF